VAQEEMNTAYENNNNNNNVLRISVRDLHAVFISR
jgi:Fe-S cluster assembly iron-binding protein IscA